MLCHSLVVLVSEQSLNSGWVMFEVGAAWGLGKEINPMVGPETRIQELPGPLGNMSCIEIEASGAPSRVAEHPFQPARFARK